MQGASHVALGLPLSCLHCCVQVLRGVRLHATRFLKGLEADADLRRSQLGLAHSYSRAKVRLGARKSCRHVACSHMSVCKSVCFPSNA